MIAALMILVSIIFAANDPANTNNDKGNQHINFVDRSWESILATAREENKSVFIDISASWCGYCKRMKSRVFNDPDVAEYYNSTFINVAVDGQKEKGRELADKYNVKGYPTFVFLNPDGSLALIKSGYHNKEKFIKLGKNASSN